MIAQISSSKPSETIIDLVIGFTKSACTGSSDTSFLSSTFLSSEARKSFVTAMIAKAIANNFTV